MAKLQKSMGNPKIMAAMEDVQKNGPGAMAKYASDPEIMSLLNDLKEIL